MDPVSLAALFGKGAVSAAGGWTALRALGSLFGSVPQAASGFTGTPPGRRGAGFPTTGRRGIGAGLQESTTDEFGSILDEAYAGEMTAARAAINRQLAEALRRTDILYGGRGVFRSGELAGEHRRLEETALRSVSETAGGLGLERARLGLAERQLTQTGMLGQAQLALQEAQMRQAGEAAQAGMWTQLGAAAIDPFMEYALPALAGLFGSGQPSLTISPQRTLGWGELRGSY